MRIGFLGLGRLGLPIAAVLSQHHTVDGYDPDPETAARLVNGHPWEKDLSNYLGGIGLAATAEGVVATADVVVVAVPTPHKPGLDGTHPTDERAPFDLSYVEAALRSVGHGPPVVLLSTVLPGDCRRLAPLVSELVYSPQFIAMGTTIPDFTSPEFLLAGGTDTMWVHDIFDPVCDFDVCFHESWETIELAKMAYNTAIGAKLALANTVGWLADETGADGGKVMDVLSQATDRIVSPAYMRPGLGDGGACHPRDQVALSWLARKHGVYDFFSDIIDQRNAHSEWIASVVERYEGEPIILGAAYKPDSPLTDGSPALLLANQTGWEITENPDDCHGRVVVIGCAHSAYRDMDIDAVVIDPWGIVPGAIHPGRLS